MGNELKNIGRDIKEALKDFFDYKNTSTYTHDSICLNCITWNRFKIPKGTTWRNFERDKTCRNCGCKL